MQLQARPSPGFQSVAPFAIAGERTGPYHVAGYNDDAQFFWLVFLRFEEKQAADG